MAVWLALRHFIGSRLELPFEVSIELAQWMKEAQNIEITRASERQSPRRPPGQKAPALLFSGGMDSMAASLLLPAGTRHLFLDRIVHLRPGEKPLSLIDLARQRDACRAVESGGGEVFSVADDHEHLYLPYPIWHSNVDLLPAFYLADSLGIGVLDSGEVLDAKYFGGYHAGDVDGWRMKRRVAGAAAPRVEEFLAPAGLARAASIAGLSEVATTALVGRIRYRDRSFSCYYPAEGGFCMRCDKCFKKLLLRHISDGKEVPKELFEHFISQPNLAAIFARPFFDWHHVWYYLFQKMRCSHWFASELNRQAREGPDLSCLEKWYPKAAVDMAPAYADLVRARIAEETETMSEQEMDFIENVEIPPLYAPVDRLGSAVRSASAAPAQTIRAWSAEIRALYKLLRRKLPAGEHAAWGGYRLDEVFLRPGDDAVCLWLSRAPQRASLPAGGALVVRLFRRRDEAHAHARLGSLAIFCESPGPPDRALVRGLLGSLREVFEQARREIEK